MSAASKTTTSSARKTTRRTTRKRRPSKLHPATALMTLATIAAATGAIAHSGDGSLHRGTPRRRIHTVAA